MMTFNPTLEMFDRLTDAFDHYNKVLFDDELPQCLILVARKKNAAGYFWPKAFKSTGGKERNHEICLNPDSMHRSAADVHSTLVHEMVHLWQEEFGKPGKGAYHNKQWCRKMLELGLEPYSRRGKGEKATGTRVSHTIMEGEAFMKAFMSLPSKTQRIDWASSPQIAEKRPNSRYKLVCPECGQTIWGNDRNHVKCLGCDVTMQKED